MAASVAVTARSKTRSGSGVLMASWTLPAGITVDRADSAVARAEMAVAMASCEDEVERAVATAAPAVAMADFAVA